MCVVVDVTYLSIYLSIYLCLHFLSVSLSLSLYANAVSSMQARRVMHVHAWHDLCVHTSVCMYVRVYVYAHIYVGSNLVRACRHARPSQYMHVSVLVKMIISLFMCSCAYAQPSFIKDIEKHACAYVWNVFVCVGTYLSLTMQDTFAKLWIPKRDSWTLALPRDSVIHGRLHCLEIA